MAGLSSRFVDTLANPNGWRVEMDQIARIAGVYDDVHDPAENLMIRIMGALLSLALIVALVVAGDAWSFSVAETLAAVVLIIAFGVGAAGWTIRRNV